MNLLPDSTYFQGSLVKGIVSGIFAVCLLIVILSFHKDTFLTPAERPLSISSLSVLPDQAKAFIAQTLGREDSKYHITRNAGVYKTENPTYGYGVSFLMRGPAFTSANGAFSFHLKDNIYAKPSVSKNRITYKRGDISEWYANTPLGLEQGFTIQKDQDSNNSQIILSFDTDNLRDISVHHDKKGLTFVTKEGESIDHNYLYAFDANGKELSSQFVIGQDGKSFAIVVDDSDAIYPVTIDPYTQKQKITASDGAANDLFGVFSTQTVAFSPDGTHIAIYGKDSTTRGAVYVYTLSGGTWGNEQIITPSDAANGDYFGYPIITFSNNGNILIISADQKNSSAGAVYAYTLSGGTYGSEQKITASDGAANDLFGVSIALSNDGTYLVIAAKNNNSSRGAVYAYTRSGGTYGSEQKITASDKAAGDTFGFTLSLSSNGTYLIVSAAYKNSAAGAIYAYTLSGGTYGSEQKITASDGAANDQFGYVTALSSDGTYLLTSAPFKNTHTGAVYAYTRSGGTYGSEQKITASNGAANDIFGYETVLSGDNIHVAMYGKDSNTRGAVYVYTLSGGTWGSEQIIAASDIADGDYFGYPSIVFSGNGSILVAAAERKNSNTGAVYTYTLSGGTYSGEQKLTASDGAAGDYLGDMLSVSSDGAYVLASAPYKNSSTGALYVFYDQSLDSSITPTPVSGRSSGDIIVTASTAGGPFTANDFLYYLSGDRIAINYAYTRFAGDTFLITASPDQNASPSTEFQYYATSFGGDCKSSGDITVEAHTTKTCVVTHTYSAPAITAEPTASASPSPTQTTPVPTQTPSPAPSPVPTKTPAPAPIPTPEAELSPAPTQTEVSPINTPMPLPSSTAEIMPSEAQPLVSMPQNELPPSLPESVIETVQSIANTVQPIVRPLIDTEPIKLPEPLVKTTRQIVNNIPGNEAAVLSVATVGTGATITSSMVGLGTVARSLGDLFDYSYYILFTTVQLMFLRKRRKPWGIVYDSVTRRPVPFAKVQVITSNLEIADTQITDENGRFGFLIAPQYMQGTIQVTVQVDKRGYIFPSRHEPNSYDYLLYNNIYRGDSITVSRDAEISFDIPIDPVSAVSVELQKPGRFDNFIVRGLNTGSLVAVAAAPLEYLHSPNLLNLFTVLLVLIFGILRFWGIKPKLFGFTVDKVSGVAIPFVMIKLTDAQGTRIASTVSDHHGRYSLLVKPGSYVITANTPEGFSPAGTAMTEVFTKQGLITKQIDL